MNTNANKPRASETIYIILSKVINLTVKGEPKKEEPKTEVINLIVKEEPKKEEPKTEVRGDFNFTIYNKAKKQLEANEPVKYQTGCYLIINLVSGTYQITIDSTFYHQAVVDIVVNNSSEEPPNLKNLITEIKLEPKTKSIVL